MDVNPYAADLRRLTDALSAADDACRQAGATLAEMDGGPNTREEDLAGARERLATRQRAVAEVQERLTNAQQALSAFEANPPPPNHYSPWKYGLIGAGALAVLAAGGAAIWGVVAIGEAVVTGAMGAVAGGVVGGGLGAATAAETNQKSKQTAQQAFAERRTHLARAVDEARAALESATAAAAAAQATVTRQEGEIRTADERRASLNRAECEANLHQAEAERAQCVAQRDAAQVRFDALEVLIGPLRHEIERLDRALEHLEREYTIARDLHEELNEPGARKGRVHEACRNHFEYTFPGSLASQPRKIAEKLQQQMAPKQRAHTKLSAEVAAIVRVHVMDIQRVVFDGNNLCYSAAKSFVGLGALAAACAAVRTQRRDVLVVFDPHIRRQLNVPRNRATVATIRDVLGPDIAITVAPMGTRADEIVLGEARDSHSAAVSNDGFQEARAFPDRYPVLSEQRVFPHVIVSPRGDSPGQVEVKALGVFATWT
jgi:hypothetical protein